MEWSGDDDPALSETVRRHGPTAWTRPNSHFLGNLAGMTPPGGADASVRSVDLAANLLASASADGTVRLWSAERMGEGEGGGPPPAAAEGAEAGA